METTIPPLAEKNPLGMALSRIKRWLSKLVDRQADMLEIFSGLTLIGMAGLGWFNVNRDKTTATVTWLESSAPAWVWFSVAILAAVLQLTALRIYDPRCPLHPFLQWKAWFRALAAACSGAWYLNFFLATLTATGIYHTHALYTAFIGMNLYTIAHVLSRRTR